MPAKRGNKNALKHGLYARHIDPDDRPALAAMPDNEIFMELAAARLQASHAIELFKSVQDTDTKLKVINISILALEAVVNIVTKLQLLSGNAPILQDLWTAIQEANQLDAIPDDV